MNKSFLKNLNQHVLTLHGLLLTRQKELHEKKAKTKINPYEFLNLAIHHPDFAWLRTLSALVASLDERMNLPHADHSALTREAVMTLNSFLAPTQTASREAIEIQTASQENAEIREEIEKIRTICKQTLIAYLN